MEARDHHLSVLMFPWLAHGHIFPFLELSKKLSQRNFYIYFCSTPINLSSIREQLVSDHHNDLIPSIQLVELHLPSLPNLPPQSHTTKSLPPHLLSTLNTALDLSQESFSQILNSLKPDLLIYDFIQPWAPELAAFHNIPAIHFLNMGALASCYFYHRCKSSIGLNQFMLSSPTIYLEEHEDQRISQLLEASANNILNKDRFTLSVDRSQSVVLIKTYKDIESKFIDHLSLVSGKEMVPVGPLVEEKPTNNNGNHELGFIMEWLSKKDKSSTVFVSFGSEYYMSREEIEDTAYGLELSEVNFIWVIRFAEGEEVKLDEVLPQGFLERIGERGLVVEGWAPQLQILGHSSIGGFVSHCGWSSVTEAVKFGVPIIAMPMQIDQPLNARLVVEFGLGLEAKREKGRRDGTARIAREEVAKVIREIVVENEGEKVRRQAKEMSEKMRMQGDVDIDALVQKLLHLFQRKG